MSWLGPAVPSELRPFHDRPFRVIGGHEIAAGLFGTIADPALEALPALGSIDQLTDLSDLLSNPQHAARLESLYQPERDDG